MEGEERAVVPGLFELQLPINTVENIDQKIVTSQIIQLKHDLRSRLGGPEELAIRNLLGLLSFRIRDYESAIGHFEAVLSKDADNLNALANQQFVMEGLYRMAEAQSYKDRHEGLLQLGDAPSDEQLKQRRRLKARCLAEQGYTHACGIYIDKHGENRYRQANHLYEDAFQLAGDLVEPSEKDNWKFCMAKNSHKICDFFYYEDEFESAVEFLREAETLFYEVTQSNPGDPEYKWESWRHLADLIRAKITRKRAFKHYVFRPELQEYVEDPEKCMERALEIAPENAKLLARYANFVHSLRGPHFVQRAIALLDRSITLDKSDNNFYAFSTRARINLTVYKSERNRSHGPPIPDLLEEARKDFETSLSLRETSWDFAYLGEVYHLLATHTRYREEPEVVGHNLEKALLYFKKSADSLDGESRLNVHLKPGLCLRDMGDYLGTIVCLRKAVVHEHKLTSFTGNFTELLHVYLHLLQQDQPEPLDDWPLLKEMLDDLKTAQIKYGKCDMERFSISKLKPTYKEEIRRFGDYCQRRPEHKDLVPLLTSVTQRPPFAPPLSSMGCLEKPWKEYINSRFNKGRVATGGALSASSNQPSSTGFEQSSKATHQPHKGERYDDSRIAGASDPGGSREGGGAAEGKLDVASLAVQLEGMHTMEGEKCENAEKIEKIQDKTNSI